MKRRSAPLSLRHFVPDPLLSGSEPLVGIVGKKLYVGNLPDSATEKDLSDKFAAFGTVKSVKLITDRDTSRTRGFGFIEMMSAAEAQAAIDSLNGSDYDGRPMKVNEARTLRNVYGGGGNR